MYMAIHDLVPQDKTRMLLTLLVIDKLSRDLESERLSVDCVQTENRQCFTP
jgi:hypothetical protein